MTLKKASSTDDVYTLDFHVDLFYTLTVWVVNLPGEQEVERRDAQDFLRISSVSAARLASLCPCLPIESSYLAQFSSQPPVTVPSAPLCPSLPPSLAPAPHFLALPFSFLFPPVEVFLLRSWHHFLRAGHTHSRSPG